MPKKYKHGFCVIPAQPFHIGHDRLIRKMLQDCECTTIVIGSAQESGTQSNPLQYNIRKKMIQNVYRNTEEYQNIWILGVSDTLDVLAWPNLVLQEIAKARDNVQTPDVFYGGANVDYEWFKFYVPNFVLCDRTTQDFPFLSGSMVREMIQYQDIRWKNFVHPENHEIIIKNMIK